MVLNQIARVLSMTKKLKILIRKQHNAMIKQTKLKVRRLIDIVVFVMVMET